MFRRIDSTVAAVIANKAVGDLLHCVYVDTGFMRKNETEEIEAMLAEQGINLITVKAADRYFEALKGVTEPEQKRKVIGELFIRIFEDEQRNAVLNTSYKERLHQTGLSQVVVSVIPSNRITMLEDCQKT